MEIDGQLHGPSLYPGKDPISVVQEAGWVLGSMWTAEISPTGL